MRSGALRFCRSQRSSLAPDTVQPAPVDGLLLSPCTARSFGQRLSLDIIALSTGPSLRLLISTASAAALLGCSHTVRQPPGLPPTPKTITREDPGGDAFDPRRAALTRLAVEEWGWRNDKRDVVHFPLTDWKNWRRVRYWGVPTFVGFRYGDDHRAVAALWVRKVQEQDAATAEQCMKRFEDWAMPLVEGYGGHVVRTSDSYVSWRGDGDLLVRSVDAEIKSLFAHQTWYGAIGAAVGWPTVCVVYGYGFRAEDAEQEAARARDRYVKEGFQRLGRIKDQLPDGVL